jgi:hypothetical protein
MLSSGRPEQLFYISHPDRSQSATTMATDLPTISQPASKPALGYQRTCSLTHRTTSQPARVAGMSSAYDQ